MLIICNVHPVFDKKSKWFSNNRRRLTCLNLTYLRIFPKVFQMNILLVSLCLSLVCSQNISHLCVLKQAYLIMTCQFGCEFMNSHHCTKSLMEKCNTISWKPPDTCKTSSDRVNMFHQLNLWASKYIYTSEILIQNQVHGLFGCKTSEVRFLEDSRGQSWCSLHHLSLTLQVSANCCLIRFESKVSILSWNTLCMQTQCAQSCHLWMCDRVVCKMRV